MRKIRELVRRFVVSGFDFVMVSKPGGGSASMES